MADEPAPDRQTVVRGRSVPFGRRGGDADQSVVTPDPVMISWKASGTLVVEHFPADRA